MAYDEVEITFVDQTTTIIHVDEDDSVSARVAEVAEEEGIGVFDYRILSSTDDRQELH